MEAPADAALWQRIADHRIGPADASLAFTDRLARENRWNTAHAERVVSEYKRFCYLAMTAGSEVTPSDAVDLAWHLHLTYSRDYWHTFCREVLGRDLHHGPTQGGPVERDRFYRQYAATLAAYETAFGHAPPADIWPGAHRRFAVDPREFALTSCMILCCHRRVALALGLLLVAAGWLAGRIV